MSWDQWIVLTCGVSGVFLAQTRQYQKYACFPGILGQVGWFAGVSWTAQPGIFLVCVLYSAVWIWGLWNFWMWPWLDSYINGAMTVTAAPLTPPRHLTAAGSRKPKLRLVRKD